MYEILNFFKVIFDFAFRLLQSPFYIYGVDFTLWEVFLFVLVGGVLLGFAFSFFID